MGLLLAGNSRVVVDLSPVAFFDSTALGVLIGFHRNLITSGILAITCTSRPVLKVFEVTGLDRTFRLFPTVDAALGYVTRAPLPTPERPGPTGAPRVNEDLASQTGGEGPASGSPEPADVHVSLTEDAAMVLAIASTAMPFAQSRDAQAERWLRALRTSGEAGIVLMSLGTSNDPGEGTSDCAVEDQSGRAMERDVVAAITREARLIADLRKHRAIHTTDLLDAVMDVYGPTFARALTRHGVNADDMTKRLGFEAARKGQPDT
jgi:hypothetical protein